jgi:hypothetical protein
VCIFRLIDPLSAVAFPGEGTFNRYVGSLSCEPSRPEQPPLCHVTDEFHQQKVKTKAHKKMSFPFRLYAMLEYASDNGHSWALSWTDNGRSFTIHHEDWFFEHIVPIFFNQTKFRSFVRPFLSGTWYISLFA